ncbi:MAG: FkbM family methyltransferase [Pseudomonadota bacterium]
MLDHSETRGPSPHQIHQALWAYSTTIDAFGLIAAAAKTGLTPKEGCVTNFQGARIPVSVCPDILGSLQGTLEAAPAPGNWHACVAEWGAALHAVDQANPDTAFRMVELGCGWACWMLATGIAARSRGLRVELRGVEADPDHLRQAKQVMELNNFSSGEFQLHNAIAAPRPGTALFPCADRGHQTDWGRGALFDTKGPDGFHSTLPCITLSDLSEGRKIDLLHMDIQGGELDFVRGAWNDINSYVNRVLIGTHGRIIEGALFEKFTSHGWTLEVERPAICRLENGHHEVIIDGVQLWCSPNGLASS